MNYNGHLLQLLRMERDRLAKLLSHYCSSQFIDDCCRGLTSEFKEEYFRFPECLCDDGECTCDLEWISIEHQEFYSVCNEIARIERMIYTATPKFKLEPRLQPA